MKANVLITVGGSVVENGLELPIMKAFVRPDPLAFSAVWLYANPP